MSPIMIFLIGVIVWDEPCENSEDGLPEAAEESPIPLSS